MATQRHSASSRAGKQRKAPPPIRNSADAHKFLAWLRRQNEKAMIINEYYDLGAWKTRVKDMLEHLHEEEGADAIREVVQLLLSEELMKPCYQNQVQRMLCALLSVELSLYLCLQKYPNDSLLFRCLLLVSSAVVHENGRKAATLDRLRDRLQDNGLDFYVPALNNLIRQQLETIDTAYLPSMRHDNDMLDYRQIEVCPTEEEVLSNAMPYLPSVEHGSDIMDNHQLAVLDAQFRLLREDFVGILRDGLRDNNRDGRKQAKKLQQAHIIGIECAYRPVFRVSFGADLQAKSRRAPKKKSHPTNSMARILQQGSLVCLRFPQPDQMLFGTVATNSRNVDLLDEHCVDIDFGIQSVTHCFERFRDGTIGELIVVCPGYFAYEPVLRALQAIEVVPLGDSLIDGAVQRAECDLRHNPLPAELQGQIDALDQKQRIAYHRSLREQVTLIQGPPGTGKTHVGSLLGQTIYHGSNCNLLCVCYTNHALDQFLEALVDAGITDVVRIGGNCKSVKLEEYKFEKKRSAPANKFTRSEGMRYCLLKEHLDRLKKELQELGETLQKQGSKGQQLGGSWSWRLVSSFLRKFHAPYFNALSISDVQDGDFSVVGRSGGEMKPDELWQCWIHGDDLPAGYEDRRDTATWRMNRAARRQKVEQWQNEMFTAFTDQVLAKIQEFHTKNDEMRMLHDQRDARVLENCRVIGVTTTGAAKYKQLLLNVNTEVVLVEEASEVLEAHIFTALVPTTKHLIMIGDHEQLRPKAANYKLTEEARGGHSLNVSTFERLIRAGFPFETLTQQHRMRPEISSFVRELVYPNLHDHPEATAHRPQLKGIDRPVVFVQHDKFEEGYRKTDNAPVSQSHRNTHEVQMVAKIVRYLVLQGYTVGDMAVLTPYLGQLVDLRAELNQTWSVLLNELDKEDLIQHNFSADTATDTASAADSTLREANGAGQKLRIATIDNFQGEEAKIAIISLVRSNPRNVIGFLGHKQRVNVLLSRARDAMILVGNPSTLCGARGEAGAMWQSVLRNFKRQRYISNGLPLKCQNHGTLAFARVPEDFPAFGGCEEICNHQLACGHHCRRLCHLDDADHRAHKCKEVVHETCQNSHYWTRPCHDTTARCNACIELEQLEYQAMVAQRRRDNAIEQMRTKQAVKSRELELRRKELEAEMSVEAKRESASQEIKKAEATFETLRQTLEQDAADATQALRSRLSEIQNEKAMLESKMAAEQNHREQEIRQQIEMAAKDTEEMKTANHRMDETITQALLQQTHKCCLCDAEQRQLDGLFCGSSESLREHFLCRACFSDLVAKVMIADDILSIEQLELSLRCPVKACCSEPFLPKMVDTYCTDKSLMQSYEKRRAELRDWQQWQPPSYWRCSGRIDWNGIFEHGYEEHDVPPDGEEYHAVLQQGRFAETLPNFTVKKVVRIENPHLWQSYADQRKKITRLRSNANEMWLWHGCRMTDPAVIKRSNVDFRHSDTGLYGRGSYFAVDASYSDMYAHKSDLSRLFLCRVAVGTMKDLRSSQQNKLVKPPDGYDSVFGTVGTSSDAYIVYQESQCYPEYEIWYKRGL